MKIIDLTGQKFGKLTVVRRVEDKIQPSGQRKTAWLCRCECGGETIVTSTNLKNTSTQSCGCLQKQIQANNKSRTTHGMSYTRLYRIWNGMRQRCDNPKAVSYKYYGGEGKAVCEEWNTFATFRDWALRNGYQDGLTIDRIDGMKGYTPDNCRWVNRKTQQNNRRNNHSIIYNGEKLTVAQLATKYNMNYSTVCTRLWRGWDIEKAISTSIK